MDPIVFDKGDAPYLQWLAEHPRGFVVNTSRSPKQDDVVLHRAAYWTISRLQPHILPGGFTERQYIKVCSTSLDSLRLRAKLHGCEDGSFSHICRWCAE